MVTKPCARTGQKDCLGTITARDVGQLARRRYCSTRCAAHARIAAGIRPPNLPHAFRVKTGSMGGRTSGVNRRKAASLRAAEALKPLIPKEMKLRMTDVDYRRMLALLSRAWLRGNTAGRSAARMVQKGQAA